MSRCCDHPGEVRLTQVTAAACCAGSETPGAAATPAASAAEARPLTSLRAGQTAVVSTVTFESRDAALVRAMGLRPNALLRVCRAGEPCIVEVFSGCAAAGGGASTTTCACRIGLSRPLAERVLVTAAPTGVPA